MTLGREGWALIDNPEAKSVVPEIALWRPKNRVALDAIPMNFRRVSLISEILQCNDEGELTVFYWSGKSLLSIRKAREGMMLSRAF